jgi:hypothetical protein
VPTNSIARGLESLEAGRDSKPSDSQRSNARISSPPYRFTTGDPFKTGVPVPGARNTPFKFGSDFLFPLLRADDNKFLNSLKARVQRICQRGSDQNVLWVARLLRDCLDSEAASAPNVPMRVQFVDIPSGLTTTPKSPNERGPNPPEPDADLVMEGKPYVSVSNLCP